MLDKQRERLLRNRLAAGGQLTRDERRWLAALVEIRRLPSVGTGGVGYADEDEAPRGG